MTSSVRALLLLCVPSLLAAQSPSPRDAVAAAWRANIEALRSNDATGFADRWTADGIYAPIGAKTLVGRAAIDSTVRGVLGAMRITSLTDQTDEIVVDGNMAFQRGTYVEVLEPRAGGAAITLRHRYLIVWQRQAGAWKMARAMTNDVPEAR